MASKALFDVQIERQRQDKRWGQQNHPDGTDADYELERDKYQEHCKDAAKGGFLTWRHILLEETYEALAEEFDTQKLRAELIQVAAVAVAWAEAIDRRQNGRRHQSEG